MLQDSLEEALVVVLRYSSTQGGCLISGTTGCGTKSTRQHSHFPRTCDFTENAPRSNPQRKEVMAPAVATSGVEEDEIGEPVYQMLLHFRQ
jgi:hypothetical protein